MTPEKKDPRTVARDEELARQEAVRKAVDEANRKDLPKLGGKQ